MYSFLAESRLPKPYRLEGITISTCLSENYVPYLQSILRYQVPTLRSVTINY